MLLRVASAFLMVMTALGCGKNPYNLIYGHKRGDLFTASPMKVADLTQIVALGNLNPPGHVFPTDHMYFYYRTSLDDTVVRKVYAPASGRIEDIGSSGGGDQSLRVIVNSRMQYDMGHIFVSSSLKVGDTITAGQEIGTNGGAYGIDLGVVDAEVTAGFINPKRYPCSGLHKISAWSVFTPSVQAELLPKSARLSGDPGGTFVHDKAGTMAGNWFGDGLPETDQANVISANPKHLAIVYDNFLPTQIRVSFGGDLNATITGAYGVQAGAMAPENTSVDSGTVCYELRNYNVNTHQSEATRVGYLLLKLVNGGQLSAEVVETTTVPCSGALTMSAGAKTYYR